MCFSEQVFKHLQSLPFAPSVGMHEVPRESLSEHLGLPLQKELEKEESDDLDEKLGREFRTSRIMYATLLITAFLRAIPSCF